MTEYEKYKGLSLAEACELNAPLLRKQVLKQKRETINRQQSEDKKA